MSIKNIFKVSGLTFFSRIMGLIRDVLLARYLGAGILSDAFFVALKIPNLFRKLFAEGAMQSAFIPIFSKILKMDEKKSKNFINEVFVLWFFLILFLVIILEIFTPFFLSIISPGLKSKGQEIFDLTVLLLRITLPYLFFIALTTIYTSILNTLNRFSLVAFLPVLLNIFIIVFLFFGDLFTNYALAASWGVFFGGFFQLVFILFGFRKIDFKPNFILIKKLSIGTRSFFKKVIPVILGGGVHQISVVINLLVASLLPYGAISYLFYADRIFQLPLALIGIAIATVILPFIAKNQNDEKYVESYKKQAILWSFAFAIPATLGLIIFAPNIIVVIFLGGNFSYQDTLITSKVLTIYALALPISILIKVILTMFYAKRDTKSPFYITVMCLLINIILVFILAKFYKVYGIALATTITTFLNLVLLLIFATKKSIINLSYFKEKEIYKIIKANIIFAIFLLIMKKFISYNFGDNMFLYRITFIGFIIFTIFIMIGILKFVKSKVYNDIIGNITRN